MAASRQSSIFVKNGLLRADLVDFTATVLGNFSFTLVLRGPIQGDIEVEDGLESLTVYAWTGCTNAILSHNGKELYRY